MRVYVPLTSLSQQFFNWFRLSLHVFGSLYCFEKFITWTSRIFFSIPVLLEIRGIFFSNAAVSFHCIKNNFFNFLSYFSQLSCSHVLSRYKDVIIIYFTGMKFVSILYWIAITDISIPGHPLRLASIGILLFYFVEFTRWNFPFPFFRIVPGRTNGCHLFVMHRLVSFQRNRYLLQCNSCFGLNVFNFPFVLEFGNESGT